MQPSRRAIFLARPVAQLNFPDRLWRKVVLAGPLMFFLSAFCTGAAPGWLAGLVLCVPTHHCRVVIIDPAAD